MFAIINHKGGKMKGMHRESVIKWKVVHKAAELKARKVNRPFYDFASSTYSRAKLLSVFENVLHFHKSS